MIDEELFDLRGDVDLHAVIHATSAELVTSHTRNTKQAFAMALDLLIQGDDVGLPTGQYRSRAGMEIGFWGMMRFSFTSQGFGVPVSRYCTPFLKEPGSFLRNTRRDFQRDRRSCPTDIKGGIIAKSDIIWEEINHEGFYQGEESIVYLAVSKLIVLDGHSFRNSKHPAPM
jgi:hypothetical protein